MKITLNEELLNAYIYRAINEEIDELFGSRVRKQSKRMITGQGWGNQKRSTNGFMAANSDISDTDADEVVPQTLVGMIRKMEQGLVSIEQMAGLPGNYEGLGEKVAAYKNGGGLKMKQSLLNAINALSRIADRTNAVERMSGSNAIMESAGDYMDAAAGGNAAIGNARNMGQLNGLQKAANAANGRYGAATREFNRKLTDVALNKGIDAEKASINAMKTLGQNNIKLNTGFWGKQAANMKNGLKTAGEGINTLKGARGAQNVANATTKFGKAAKTTGNIAKGVGQVAKGIGQASQIALLLLSIADEAARQGAEARQRKIIRTYNCASVLAKRLSNIAQEIANAQGGQETTGQIQEINVKKSKSHFGSIETGMNELSNLMKQIYSQLQGQTGREAQMPASLNTPQGIKQFQEWANTKGYKDNAGQPLAVDGIWGPRTEYVYNQIAQQQNNIQESKKRLYESNAVMNALNNLENKVGTTGAGGRAYSDISSMSGGLNGSRSQNARNTKFIIRTYPPVLNQYLEVLANAGANVGNLQPLKVDNRPNRDYDVNEIQEIDNRIQILLKIAQNVGNITPRTQTGPVQLPPKPIINRPKAPAQAQQQVPQTTREPLPTMSDSPLRDLTQQASVDAIKNIGANIPPETILRGTPIQRNIATTSAYQMAGNPNLTRQDIRNTTAQVKHGINVARDNGDISQKDARREKQLANQNKRTLMQNI